MTRHTAGSFYKEVEKNLLLTPAAIETVDILTQFSLQCPILEITLVCSYSNTMLPIYSGKSNRKGYQGRNIRVLPSRFCDCRNSTLQKASVTLEVVQAVQEIKEQLRSPLDPAPS
jgi:hypothetical protein